MVKQIKWNKRALADFKEIAEYLEEKFSLQSAHNFVGQLYGKIDAVSKHPTIGRKTPKRKTVRFILVGKYRRLYYRTEGHTLIISSIFDTRQHPDKDSHR